MDSGGLLRELLDSGAQGRLCAGGSDNGDITVTAASSTAATSAATVQSVEKKSVTF